jgi:alanyl-tRNA synthetase
VLDSVVKLSERIKELERAARRDPAGRGAVDVDALVAAAADVNGAVVLTAAVEVADGQALLELADRLKAKLGDAAIVLGRGGEDRVDLVAVVAPELVQRGVRAGEIIKVAAAQVGGGGGGRDTMARAGGKNPAKLPTAIDAARTAIDAALNS